MSQLHIAGVAFHEVKGQTPTARLALAYRKGNASKLARNFMAVALSN